MGAISPTKVVTISSPGGEYVEKIFTVTPASASDTIDLTTHFDDILAIRTPHITAGQDANFMTAHATESGETITLVSLGADGGAATNWDGASITIGVVGTAYPQ